MDPLLDVCVRGPIMDPLLDVCVRGPIMDPVLEALSFQLQVVRAFFHLKLFRFILILL